MDFKEIEKKWAEKWISSRIFESDPDNRAKIFVTFPFPYMNGPLHIGHAFTSTRVDVYARYKRMKGYNVLFPWAWHLTGEPIAGAAERLKRGDMEQYRIFKEVDGVPEEEIKKFVDPVYMAKYYINESKRVLKLLGHSIDWRREFTTTYLDPWFSKFIEWQYLRLRELGFVRKGTHPVVWCPRCKSPTGDHDRLRGEGVSPVEFIILLFKLKDEDCFLAAATLRPETLFGVTNIWLNPDVKYVKITLNGKKMIIAKRAVEKFKEQFDNVKILEEFKGVKYIGKEAIHPIFKQEVIVLPASFVKDNIATAVVMSVPAHAPYDYVALRDLLKDEEKLKKYKLSKEIVERIKPISLIKLEGYSELPAKDIVEKMGIENQLDEKLEEATSIIYREEFYKGILKEITGKYANKVVKDVKKQIVEDFINGGFAFKFYDLPEEVVCRCNTECLVKILKDQWFLKYSDEKWKEEVRKALKHIRILPEEAREEFIKVIDWLEDKACARRTGLGTKLPWDKEWIVETLSDSTVYMAFYTISKTIKEKNIKPEQLTKELFDYIFYGKGNVRDISKATGISEEVIEEMRREFDYYYPVDLRISAKELIPNHLTFYIFHHVALFPNKLPRTIGVNGMIFIEGKKMSKKLGNFITIKKMLEEFGASVTRASLMLLAEGLKDPDFRYDFAKDIEKKLKDFFNFVLKYYNVDEFRTDIKIIDKWLISRIQEHIKNYEEHIENLRTRSALLVALYEIWNDIRWYLKRDKPNIKVLREAIEIWLKLLTPYIPALTEELWYRIGKSSFISLERIPDYDRNKISNEALIFEEMLERLVTDIREIIEFKNLKPKKIYIYTASRDKWIAYLKIAEKLKNKEEIKLKNLIEEIKHEVKNIKRTINFLQNILKDVSKVRENIVYIDEKRLLLDAKTFIEKEFNCEAIIYEEDEDAYDPMKKKHLSIPLKPAIYIEE